MLLVVLLVNNFNFYIVHAAFNNNVHSIGKNVSIIIFFYFYNVLMLFICEFKRIPVHSTVNIVNMQFFVNVMAMVIIGSM